MRSAPWGIEFRQDETTQVDFLPDEYRNGNRDRKPQEVMLLRHSAAFLMPCDVSSVVFRSIGGLQEPVRRSIRSGRIIRKYRLFQLPAGTDGIDEDP